MDYRRFEDTVILRVDPGEEIFEQLTRVADEMQIELAQVDGLGALKELNVGVYNAATKDYHSNLLTGAYEIVSLMGTITRMEGKSYLHIHLSAADMSGHMVGGHLNRAVVSATAELVIRLIDGKAGRKKSEKVGLNLLDFDS